MVLIIISLGVSLVGPATFRKYEKIKAWREEQRLRNTMEVISMRAFFRQVPHEITLANDKLAVKSENIYIHFDYLHFPKTTIWYNSKGFTRTSTFAYKILGQEKFLHVP